MIRIVKLLQYCRMLFHMHYKFAAAMENPVKYMRMTSVYPGSVSNIIQIRFEAPFCSYNIISFTRKRERRYLRIRQRTVIIRGRRELLSVNCNTAVRQRMTVPLFRKRRTISGGTKIL